MSESIYTPASGEVIDIVKDSAVYKLRDDSALRTDNLGFVEGVEGEDPTPGEGSIYKMTIGEEEHLIRDASAIHTTDTVTTSQIADGAVTEDKLGEDVTDQITALQDSVRRCATLYGTGTTSGSIEQTAERLVGVRVTGATGTYVLSAEQDRLRQQLEAQLYRTIV